MNKNQGHFQALNKEFFKKHQKKLLWLLNAPLIKYWFRWVLRIHKDLKWDEKICEIEPNNYKVYLGMYLIKGKLQHRVRADFRTHNKFSKRLYYAFKPVWWTMHFLDWIFLDSFAPRYSFGFSTLTVYPDANPETSTVDGYVGRDADESWSSIRSGGGTISGDTDASLSCMYFKSSTVSNNWWSLYRSIFLFNTSSLGSSAIINSAIMSLRGSAKSDAGNYAPTVDIYTTTPASNTSLTTGDYSQFGSMSQTGSPITYADWSITGYNDFTFNATGRGNISKTSISKFGLRNANYDASGTSPTWISVKSTELQCYYADQAGTSNDPKLVVDYTASQNYTQTISNTLTLSNNILKNIVYIISNTITLSNSFIKNISAVISNTISLSNTVQSIKLILVEIANTLNVSNSIQKGINKMVENTANLTNSIIKDIYKSISNTVNLSNIISVAKIIYKTIINIVNLSNSIIKNISKSIENTATFSNVINVIKQFVKVITNTITLSNTISKGIAKAVINTIILTTKNLFNGLTTWYSDKYQKQNTTYSDKY